MTDQVPTAPAAPPPTIDVEIVSDAGSRGHHQYGPSKLNYVGDCAGWESGEASERAMEAAERGTTLHDIMETVMREWSKYHQPLIKILTAVASANPVPDGDFQDLVFCCRELEKHINRPGAQVYLEAEVTVYNPDGSKLNHGYFDLLVIVGSVGVIIDYKFGAVPVRLAPINKQGFCYAVGTLQRHANLQRIGVIFIQPKHRSLSKAIFDRGSLTSMYQVIRDTIDLAVTYHQDPAANCLLLNPSNSCSYCKHKANGKCAAGLKHTLAVVRAIAPAQIPATLALEKIQTPEQAALCRYAVELAEEFLGGIKERAREIAVQNGGVIEATAPDGKVIRYELEERRMDRVLGGTLEIVEALSPIVEPTRLFGAAEFSLGKLEKLVAGEIHETNNAPLAAQLNALKSDLDGLVAAGKMSKTEAKTQLSAARQNLGGQKITKEEAVQRFESILSAQGLLTRPDGVVMALRKKQTAVKQITQ